MSSLIPSFADRSLTNSVQSIVSLGKYGSFQANNLIGRPCHLTYEILDEVDGATGSGLRVVPAAELYGGIDDEGTATPSKDGEGEFFSSKDGVEHEIVGERGDAVLKTNRETIDDTSNQLMTMEEIELLKAEGMGSGKDLITKLLKSHAGLDQKTDFALAKYTLRKVKKFMRRFTVLQLDVPLLVKWMLSVKEPMKIMEMREEILALVGSWSNVHCAVPHQTAGADLGTSEAREGRWLVIDETAGLLVAALSEKMGVLNPIEASESKITSRPPLSPAGIEPHANGEAENQKDNPKQTSPANSSSATLASSNTITLIHANTQPNLSLLRYFGFDAANPAPSHPLYRHLRTISWLQLLAPTEDSSYTEPALASEDVIRGWKSGKRGHYYRKRKRWERIKTVVDETRAGGFDGLIVASAMDHTSILHHTVPLLRGAAQVVIYSPTIEPLVELTDYYSTARRAAFLLDPPEPHLLPTQDFPVDPTLLLAPTIQTARCRAWQVLPGRTHPLMTSRGGAEGYLFTATRVLPAKGKVEARGNHKRRKLGDESTRASSQRQASAEAEPENPVEI